jgi:arginase family enzyme
MNSDDPRLNALLSPGNTGDIVVVGVPFDYTRKRTIHKGGEDNGPCCLRRFFPKVGPLVNPEYGIDIRDVRVTDYGNIEIENREESTAPERAIMRITEEIFEIVKNKQLPFVLGGSKEGPYAATLAFSKVYQEYRHILIAGKPTLRRP